MRLFEKKSGYPWGNMLKKILLFGLLLLLHGCSINQLFLTDEIDTITTVRQGHFVKHNRAYFSREHLLPLSNKQPYLLLTHTKRHDLGLLLRSKEHYLLYHFFSPQKSPLRFQTSRRHLLRKLAQLGYMPLTNPKERGYLVHSGPRRYKGVKTYLIDITDYTKLKRRYEDAIRNYNSAMLLGVHDQLPKQLIEPYLRYYSQRADSDKKKEEIGRIAKKLHISLEETPAVQVQYPENSDQTPYHYYRYRASMYELGNYLNSPQSRAELTPAQYTILQHRLGTLQQEKLLQEGSLETLLAAYEENHDPRFKRRIMELLKAQNATQ